MLPLSSPFILGRKSLDMSSDLSSDMRPGVKALLPDTLRYPTRSHDSFWRDLKTLLFSVY